MKLAYLANVRIPTEKAHGIQIMKMCEAFAKSGIRVELIVPKRKNPIAQTPFMYYNVASKFIVTKLPTFDLVGVISKVGFFIQSLTFFIASRLYLTRKKYDVLYTRDITTNIFFSNTILELHTLPKSISRLHKKLYLKSRIIIVLTHAMKRMLEENQVNKKIIVAPDAVDLKQFSLTMSKQEARENVHLSKDKKIILYTGHLYPWKGVDVLLEASRSFDATHQFIFIGGTEKDLRNFRKKSKNFSNTVILNSVAHSMIPQYLKAADIVVLPNSGKYEISKSFTSPIKLFEYMASETPMVVADLPSIREIINEKSAYFFTPDDAMSCANVIKVALTSEQSKTKATHAREVVEKYTWDNRVKRILTEVRR